MDAQAQARRQLEIDLRAALAGRDARGALPAAGRSREPGASSASRRCCAGRIRRAAASRRPSSSRSPRKPASSRRSATSCCSAPAPTPAQWPDARQARGQPVADAVPRRQRACRRCSEALQASGLAPAAARARDHRERAARPHRSGDRARCTRLRALGVRISMDDFGTGYSSLSYLRAFPFDKIKIDRSFVRDLPSNRHTLAIVRAILGLASGLDMKVVAEGIETQADLACLAAEGCKEGQGFLFSEARPQSEVLKLLAEAPTAPRRLSVSALALLAIEQRALALHAPAIAGELAVAAHDAMAGDGDRDVVRPAGRSDRAHRRRLADARGRSRRTSPSRRAGSHAKPPTPAAGRPCRARRVAAPVPFAAPRRRRRLAQPVWRSARSPPISLARGKRSRSSCSSAPAIIAEEDGAHAFVGRGDEHQTQRACRRRMADFARRRRRHGRRPASCPATASRRHKSGRWN